MTDIIINVHGDGGTSRRSVRDDTPVPQQEGIGKFSRFRFFNGTSPKTDNNKNVTDLKITPSKGGSAGTPREVQKNHAGAAVATPLGPYFGISYVLPFSNLPADKNPDKVTIEFKYDGAAKSCSVDVGVGGVNFIKELNFVYEHIMDGSYGDLIYGIQAQDTCEQDRTVSVA